MKRILVLGGGLIGSRHIRAVQAHPGCTLVGLVDPDAECRTEPSVRRFPQIEAVDAPVDGVIIATPKHLHAAQGMEAAARGWHMLIEKPVADDLDAARALSTAVATAGVGSLVGHHRRYHSTVERLQEMIASGELGEVVTVSLIWAMRKPDAYFDGNWRTAGGSPVMINLVHDIDMLRHVIGEISEITALRGRGLRGADRIESGAVALAFESGATGTISFADTAPSPWGFEAATGENPNIGTTGQDMMWITGTKGSIGFPSMTHWSGAADWSAAATGQKTTLEDDGTSPLKRQLGRFLDVMDGARPLVDVADATRTLAVALDIESQLAREEA